MFFVSWLENKFFTFLMVIAANYLFRSRVIADCIYLMLFSFKLSFSLPCCVNIYVHVSTVVLDRKHRNVKSK